MVICSRAGEIQPSVSVASVSLFGGYYRRGRVGNHLSDDVIASLPLFGNVFGAPVSDPARSCSNPRGVAANDDAHFSAW